VLLWTPPKPPRWDARPRTVRREPVRSDRRIERGCDREPPDLAEAEVPDLNLSRAATDWTKDRCLARREATRHRTKMLGEAGSGTTQHTHYSKSFSEA